MVPQGIAHIAKRVPALLEGAVAGLPGSFAHLIDRLLKHLKELDRQVRELETDIIAWHRATEVSRQVAEVPGIGPLTASAIVATITDAKSFENGRQVAAWLGLVPRQHSTGGKSVMLGMSKRGDTYVRTLLIHGARSAIQAAQRKPEQHSWLQRLLQRRNKNVAAVALANKNARIVWALMVHGRPYQAHYSREAAAA